MWGGDVPHTSNITGGRKRKERVGLAICEFLSLDRVFERIQARLPVLSTWLGHIDPKSTYWYLSAVPELLALAAARLEPADRDGQATS